MRKKLLIPALMAFVFVSCGGGGSFESDVRKMADLACKAQSLAAKAATDESAKAELEKVQKEAEDFGAKMEKKYKDKKDDKAMEEKAQKIMEEVMAKCK